MFLLCPDIEPQLQLLRLLVEKHGIEIVKIDDFEEPAAFYNPFEFIPQHPTEPIEILPAPVYDAPERPFLCVLPSFFNGKQMNRSHTNRLHSRKQAKLRAKRKKA